MWIIWFPFFDSTFCYIGFSRLLLAGGDAARHTFAEKQWVTCHTALNVPGILCVLELVHNGNTGFPYRLYQ